MTDHPKVVATAPAQIYLDLGFDPAERDAHFSDLSDVTWSADNASGHGIQYLRADLAAQPAQDAPLRAAAEKLVQMVRRDWPNTSMHRIAVLAAANEVCDALIAAPQPAHTPGPWHFVNGNQIRSERHQIARTWSMRDGEGTANARLIAAAPDYHDAAFWIRQAVAANAAPVNPLAALEELALDGEHITLDAGLVLDLLKAHAKATGAQA